MKARAVVTGIVLALSSWMLADVSVVNEEKAVSRPADGDSGWVPGENMGLGSARLSPDGTKLLYLHCERNVEKPEGYKGHCMWSGRIYRLALHDLKTGQEELLPIPADSWDDPLWALIARPIFSKDSKYVVVHAAVDENENGLFDKDENVELATYDVASGTLKRLGTTSVGLIPMFCPSSGRMVVVVPMMAERSIALQIIDLSGKVTKQLTVKALPLAISPTCDLAAGMVLKKERNQNLALIDLEKDKVLRQLPLAERNTKLDDISPQFTADGKYLYYIDLKDNDRRKLLTRVVAVASGEEVAVIEAHYPVGPGPGRSMVLGKFKHGEDEPAAVLHNPVGPITKPIDVKGLIIYADCKRVVIARDKELFTAEFELPKPQTQPAVEQPPADVEEDESE